MPKRISEDEFRRQLAGGEISVDAFVARLDALSDIDATARADLAREVRGLADERGYVKAPALEHLFRFIDKYVDGGSRTTLDIAAPKTKGVFEALHAARRRYDERYAVSDFTKEYRSSKGYFDGLALGELGADGKAQLPDSRAARLLELGYTAAEVEKMRDLMKAGDAGLRALFALVDRKDYNGHSTSIARAIEGPGATGHAPSERTPAGEVLQLLAECFVRYVNGPDAAQMRPARAAAELAAHAPVDVKAPHIPQFSLTPSELVRYTGAAKPTTTEAINRAHAVACRTASYLMVEQASAAAATPYFDKLEGDPALAHWAARVEERDGSISGDRADFDSLSAYARTVIRDHHRAVVVGVSYKRDPGVGNLDGITDHFLVLDAWGTEPMVDENGVPILDEQGAPVLCEYFAFIDPATEDETLGRGRLYVDEATGILYRPPSLPVSPARPGQFLPVEERGYQATSVRLYTDIELTGTRRGPARRPESTAAYVLRTRGTAAHAALVDEE